MFLWKIPFGRLGQITVSVNGLLIMDISALTLKSNAMSWSNWLMKSMFVYLSFSNLCLITFFTRYKDQNARLAAYLTWPDARLRAYLREQGVSEDYIPGDRPSLLRTFATWYLKFYTILLTHLYRRNTYPLDPNPKQRRSSLQQDKRSCKFWRIQSWRSTPSTNESSCRGMGRWQRQGSSM